MKKIVQVKNPKSNRYIKIDRSKGKIIARKISSGPYKNIEISDDIKKLNKAEQNTRSFVRQFRQVLLGLHSGQYKISEVSIKPDFDKRIMSPGAPVDTGGRILTVKHNIFQKVKDRKIDPERMDHMKKGASFGKPREYRKKRRVKNEM